MADQFTLYASGAGLWGVKDELANKVAILGPQPAATQFVSMLNAQAIPATALFWTDLTFDGVDV